MLKEREKEELEVPSPGCNSKLQTRNSIGTFGFFRYNLVRSRSFTAETFTTNNTHGKNTFWLNYRNSVYNSINFVFNILMINLTKCLLT